MLRACGLYVFNSVTTLLVKARLYTWLIPPTNTVGYNSRELPVVYPQVVPRPVHNFFTTLTEVTTTVIPTIHTTYKNNKKFYIHNLLLIYRKAVH